MCMTQCDPSLSLHTQYRGAEINTCIQTPTDNKANGEHPPYKIQAQHPLCQPGFQYMWVGCKGNSYPPLGSTSCPPALVLSSIPVTRQSPPPTKGSGIGQSSTWQ